VEFRHRHRDPGAGRLDAAKVISTAYNRYNLALGAGCRKSRARFSASAISATSTELMLLGAIAGAEMAMLDNGIKIQPGSGVAAAQAVYRANPLLKALKIIASGAFRARRTQLQMSA